MSNLVPAEDSKYLSEVEAHLQDTWSKRQVFRTETEMRISVLNDLSFPTNAAKYWQCVREQSVYYENIKRLSFDYRKKVVEIKQIQKAISDGTDEFEIEIKEIELDECRFDMLAMEQQGKDRVREIKLWEQLMLEYDDGTFDTTDPNTHQLESYGIKFSRQMESLPTSNASPSEASNLIGQHNTAMRHLEAAGMLHKDGDNLRIGSAENVH